MGWDAGTRWVGPLAAVVLFSTAAVWALATPPMNAPDEPAHTIRAAAVWHGTIDGVHDREVKPRPELGPDVEVTGTETYLPVPRAYAELPDIPGCFQFDRLATADCAPPVGEDTEITQGSTYVGAYQPTYYLIVGWPSRLLAPEPAIYAMRLVSALLASLLLASGIHSATRIAGSGLAVAGAALAITPMVLFLAGTINPSGLEIAAAFATWLGALELLKARGRPSPVTLLRVGAAVALFATNRPLSAVFAGAVLVVVLVVAGSRERMLELVRTPFAVPVAVAVALSALGSLAWVVRNRAWDAFTGISVPGLTVPEAVVEHLSLWPFRARQFVGYFGNVDAPIPDGFVWAWLAAVVALAAVAFRFADLRGRLGLLAAMGFVFVVPLYSEATRAATYGFIWQSRYSLPTAVGLPILAGYLLARHRDALVTNRSSAGSQVAASPEVGNTVAGGPVRLTLERTVALGVAVLAGVTMVVSHLAFMTRVSVGYPNPLLEYLDSPRWVPPVSPVLLLVVAVISAAGWAFLIAASANRSPIPGSSAHVPRRAFQPGRPGHQRAARRRAPRTTRMARRLELHGQTRP